MISLEPLTITSVAWEYYLPLSISKVTFNEAQTQHINLEV